MSKKTTFQRGFSAVVILSVVVAFAVGAGLVYVFMTTVADKESSSATTANTIRKESSQAEEKEETDMTSESAKTASKTSVFGDAVGESFSLTYPQNWKYQVDEKDGDGGAVSTSDVAITSPSGGFNVKVSAMINGGVGGVCPPNDTDVIRAFSYEQIAGMKDVYYTTLINTGGGQAPNVKDGYAVVQLMSGTSDTFAKIKPGTPMCDVYLANAIQSFSTQPGAAMFGSIEIKDAKDMKFSDVEELEEYKQAKAILMSLRQQ